MRTIYAMRADQFNKFVHDIQYNSTQMIKMLNWAASRHYFAYHNATRPRLRTPTPKAPMDMSTSLEVLEVSSI